MPKPARTFPTLSTTRLLLRAPTAEDADAFRDILSIPDVTRFSNWQDAPSKAVADRAMRWMCKAFPTGKGCAWIIEDRASKTMAGAIRYNWFVNKSKCGEIGYELHPDFWGKGLMTEAAAAVALCGHRFFGLNRIEAWTLPGNTGSDRVLEKAGFRYEGTLRQKARFKGAYHDFRMFGRLANDHVVSIDQN
ncbi:GNAT family N-acetyltransferase [Mesorhizobium cantuariense]|uniref:GNAT family N-acetyltransferase n=1 Tax=Mesorhizobium cantuariense TaxID=1300275 RepID=A0ABV7MMM2_9HYPH